MCKFVYQILLFFKYKAKSVCCCGLSSTMMVIFQAYRWTGQTCIECSWPAGGAVASAIHLRKPFGCSAFSGLLTVYAKHLKLLLKYRRAKKYKCSFSPNYIHLQDKNNFFIVSYSLTVFLYVSPVITSSKNNNKYNNNNNNNNNDNTTTTTATNNNNHYYYYTCNFSKCNLNPNEMHLHD